MTEAPDLSFDATRDLPQHGGYVVFDTETSGLPDNKLPADHPMQPRLAHIAMVLLSPKLEIEEEIDWYVKPDGWVMPDEMLAINGLTQRFLMEYGRPIDEVLDGYVSPIMDGRIMAAYNAQFDLKIMRGELRRRGLPDLFEQTPNICIMRAYKYWRHIFKGYKLVDACNYFGIPYEHIHRAPADALAAVEVFRSLVRAGAPIPEPAVHFHRDHAAIVARGAGG